MLTNKQNKTNDLRRGVNNFPPPPADPCIYHYTVWYVEETGQILYITFDGTTGDCDGNSGGGGGGGPQNPVYCDFTDEEASQMLEESEIESVTTEQQETNEPAPETGFESVDPETGRIQKPYSSGAMDFLRTTAPFFSRITWSAFWSGTVYKNSSSTTEFWKFADVHYSTAAQTAGMTDPCFSVSVTVVDNGTTISTNKRSATGNISYYAYLYLSCRGSYQIMKPKNDTVTPILVANCTNRFR